MPGPPRVPHGQRVGVPGRPGARGPLCGAQVVQDGVADIGPAHGGDGGGGLGARSGVPYGVLGGAQFAVGRPVQDPVVGRGVPGPQIVDRGGEQCALGVHRAGERVELPR